MQIYTSSWFTKLPVEILRLGISRAVPRGMSPGFRRLRELEPGAWLHTATPVEFHELYQAQLSALDPRHILAKIEDLADGRDAALLCYEPPHARETCHRAQVAAWLKDQIGLDVPEFGGRSPSRFVHALAYPSRARQAVTLPVHRHFAAV